jgi:outer membrane protein OmpA-like peptidoglycan-associated protein
MKKLLFLLIAANGILPATAQMKDSSAKKQYSNYELMGKWAIDLNLMGGALTRNMTTGNSLSSYLNALSDANLGNLKFTNGMSFGGDLQLGYFFGNSNHFGIGGGIMFLSQSGDATLDNFHVQYQSTDQTGEVSRQVITANQPVKESLQITNVNIPLVLKYKDRFSKRFGFTADLGVLYNVSIKNMYNTNATFDYEEIVKYVTTSDGSIITVYDNSLTPAATDLQITKNHFNNTTHADGETLPQYFALQKSLGYNVGLAQAPTQKSGTVSYTSGSLGFIVRPAINYFFSDHVALTVGAYLLYQPFNNATTNNYRLTNNVGDYSSVLNNVSKSNDMSYGGNLGIRILFGGKKQAPINPGVTAVDPSACGMKDGSITFTGLPPAKPVSINYTVDGKTNTLADKVVDPTGAVKLEKIGAGAYTGISATLGKRHVDIGPATLVNPPINISETTTNPTSTDACDGAIVLGGLKAGQKVTVNYNYNGSPKPVYRGIVSSDNAVTLSGLCAGTYSGIVVGVNDCKGNGNDVTLSVPPPPPPAVNDNKTAPLADITAPILFEFGKTSIHPSSYPVLENAVLEVGKNNNFYIICEGHTDSRGTDERNEILSFKRAEAVKKYLIKMGVSADRIIAVGRGSRMPIATNETAEGRAKNRRVVMTLNERSK